MLNKKSLINRTLVGIGIFILMLGMIALDIFVPNYIEGSQHYTGNKVISGRAVNAVIISVIICLAVIEMRRAIGRERIPDQFSWLLWLYAIGVGPAYSLFGYMGIIFFTLLVFACAAVTALAVNRVDSLMYIGYMLVYPGMFMAALLYINRCASTFTITNVQMLEFVESDIWQYSSTRAGAYLLPYNAIGLAFVFAVSSFTDMFAYFVGGLFGKHKLCPEISPKKTVEGAVGGVFGGLVGSLIVFLLFDLFHVFGPQFGLLYEGLGLSVASVAVIYVVIGLFGSAMTQIGDLLASLVKRYCGIKDYSRILGEHGGIMDRFDGIMLNAVFVAFTFMFFI